MADIDPRALPELLALLAPMMESEAARRIQLESAFGLNQAWLNDLNYSEDVETFVASLVRTLGAHGDLGPGKPALWALLETVRERVGTDQKERIDALRPF